MNDEHYTLPIGPQAPQWAQAIVALAERCREYLDQGFQTDAQLAAKINELHADLIERPRGSNSAVGAFLREGH